MKKKAKPVKLTPEQEAIIYLAKIVQKNPYTEYKILDHVLDILGLKFVKN